MKMIKQAAEKGFEEKEKERELEKKKKAQEAEAKMLEVQDRCLFDQDSKNVWSGFVTKNGKNRVAADAYLLTGKFPEGTGYNLNISHKAKPEESFAKAVKSIGKPGLTPATVAFVSSQSLTD